MTWKKFLSDYWFCIRKTLVLLIKIRFSVSPHGKPGHYFKSKELHITFISLQKVLSCRSQYLPENTLDRYRIIKVWLFYWNYLAMFRYFHTQSELLIKIRRNNNEIFFRLPWKIIKNVPLEVSQVCTLSTPNHYVIALTTASGDSVPFWFAAMILQWTHETYFVNCS